jgi:glyoxylase-like metal-dependent hydrolase (beta-lactamase superfamily II)
MRVEEIDFSCKHDVMIQNEDGTLLPMDTPYFESLLIAPGTWQIRTDGDAIYLVEGDREAMVIDSGYGAGNLRAYAQTLTEKPVTAIINTHDHFDHTANNAYFDKAYMTKETQPLATLPFPSFEGITFPRDYPVEIVKEGDKIDLGNRTLEVFEIPDHAVGSIALLDSRQRILFTGDEITPHFKKVNGSLGTVLEQMKKLWNRRAEFDIIWSGADRSCPPEIIDCYIRSLEFLLQDGQGQPGMGFFGKVEKDQKKNEGTHPREQAKTFQGTVYQRFSARLCDRKTNPKQENLYHVDQFGALLVYSKEE